MSARALRALRGDTPLLHNEEDDESEDEEEEEERKPAAFVGFDSSDEEESEEEQDVEEESSKNVPGREGDQEDDEKKDEDEIEEEEEEEEDLDALLDEFREQDELADVAAVADDEHKNVHDLILDGLDFRDLDPDLALRYMASGGSNNNTNKPLISFGKHPDWPKPPHFVGGGIGMRTCDELPLKDIAFPSQTASFVLSTDAQRVYQDFTAVQSSNQLGALMGFCRHHPYEPCALLQLSQTLYGVQELRPQALQLLKRCLFVYEAAFSKAFRQGKLYLAKDRTNETFWQALFRYLQTGGSSRHASATARLLWRLDPVRDPLRVLAVLDGYALLTSNEVDLQWVRDIMVAAQDDMFGSVHVMPNWMFSRALALHRLDQEEEAKVALLIDLQTYPCMVPALLQDVDTVSRSFLRDWPPLIEWWDEQLSKWQQELAQDSFESVEDSHAQEQGLLALERLVDIYSVTVAKLWNDDVTLQWLYDQMLAIKNDDMAFIQPDIKKLAPYANVKLSNYTAPTDQLPIPPDLLDPRLLAEVMHIRTDLPRFLRNFEQQPQGGLLGHQIGGLDINQMNMIDPDWPMLEVFWRSFLPWNHVEGVPAPRR